MNQPLLSPPARMGRPRANDRRTIEGIVYILTTGCRWQDLAREYGAPMTVWRRGTAPAHLADDAHPLPVLASLIDVWNRALVNWLRVGRPGAALVVQ